MRRLIVLAFVMVVLLVAGSSAQAHSCDDRASNPVPPAMVATEHASQPRPQDRRCVCPSTSGMHFCAACCMAVIPSSLADIPPAYEKTAFGLNPGGVPHAWIAPAEAEPPRQQS